MVISGGIKGGYMDLLDGLFKELKMHTYMTTVEDSSLTVYETLVNQLLKEGHRLVCASCDKDSWRAVFVKRELKEEK